MLKLYMISGLKHSEGNEALRMKTFWLGGTYGISYEISSQGNDPLHM